uniref:Putative ovule protein n=1 Tax=Solanum chacoense TaxID=4108 RepID=A0A0V0H5N2_SOLCH
MYTCFYYGIQVKEMGESNKPSDSVKGSELAAEKKKGFADLMKLMRPLNEEKDFWVRFMIWKVGWTLALGGKSRV